jgi:hypothetical protein
VLHARGPLLDVRGARPRVDAVVAGEPAGRGFGKAVARGQDRRSVALGFVQLIEQMIQHQVVRLDRDLGAEVDSIARAQNRAACLGKLPRQAHPGREVVALRLHTRAHADEPGRLRQSGVIQVEQVVAFFGERRGILIAHAEVHGEARHDAPIVLRVTGPDVLSQVRLSRTGGALRGLRKAQQKIGERIARSRPGTVHAREHAGVRVGAASEIALQIVHLEVEPLAAEFQRVAAALEREAIGNLPEIVALHLRQ